MYLYFRWTCRRGGRESSPCCICAVWRFTRYSDSDRLWNRQAKEFVGNLLYIHVYLDVWVLVFAW